MEVALKYNQDFRTRDKRLGIKSYCGGIAPFSDKFPSEIRNLILLGFCDPKESQNAGPSVQELLEFCEAHPKFTLSGYAVAPERPDCRITIDSIEAPDTLTAKEQEAFVMFARLADEFSLHPPRAWWD